MTNTNVNADKIVAKFCVCECKELKHIDIDCVVLDLSKEDERELNIRLNKSGGEWDFDILANQFDIEELKDWGFKEIELGLNIDKIDVEEEPKNDNYIIDMAIRDLVKTTKLALCYAEQSSDNHNFNVTGKLKGGVDDSYVDLPDHYEE